MMFFAGFMTALGLMAAFVAWIIWDNRKHKPEMQERTYD